MNIDARFQVFHRPGQPLELYRKQLPISLAKGEILVKLLLSTICASDIHTYEGKRKEPVPCILGHEGVGEIVALNQRNGFKQGDRITWTVIDSCGTCPACTENNLPEKCDRLFKYGHASLDNGSGLNGCYASHIVLRKGTHLVKIPEAVSNAVAAPANCALATMVNVISNVPDNTRSVVIQGGGLLGIYGCGLLKEQGIPQVFCLEVNRERFPLIESFGGIPIDASDLPESTSSILQRAHHPIDVVIEVAGVKQLITQGVELLRPGGKYLLAGLVHPDSHLGITAEQLIRKCLTLKGIHNYAPRHLEEAVSFLARNHQQFPFDQIVSPAFPLENLSDAMTAAQSKHWLRVSVKP